ATAARVRPVDRQRAQQEQGALLPRAGRRDDVRSVAVQLRAVEVGRADRAAGPGRDAGHARRARQPRRSRHTTWLARTWQWTRWPWHRTGTRSRWAGRDRPWSGQ